MKLRNPKFEKRHLFTILAVLLLAVVAVLFFFPDDIQGRVLQQHDIQQGLANGEEGRAYNEATGETTRWTNSLFGGMPNFQIAPSYPANNMLDWVVKVYTLFLPSPANLLFAMMLGFFLMCLCFRMRWYTSLFASLAWGFSSYFIIIIGAGHIWKFLTLAFIPPTIGGIALCYRRKYLGGMAMAALFGALQLQSNHPQMSYYFLFVIAAMVIAWLWQAYKEREMRSWGIATVCALFAGCLALGANSASLYNSYEYSKETIRGRATDIVTPGEEVQSGADFDYITGWSYGPDETLTLLIPNVKGGASLKPVGGENRIKSVVDAPAGNVYLSPEEQQVAYGFTQYFGNQPMTNGPVYVGAFVFVLAILALFVVDGPMIWALFAVTILSILLSWGHNFPAFSHFFIDNFPGYNKFRTVSSILVITEFTLPLMAAMCVRKIITTPDFYSRYKYQFFGVAGFFAFICLLGWMSPSVYGAPFRVDEMETLKGYGIWDDPAYANVIRYIRESRLALVRTDSLRSLMFIIAGSLIVWLYMSGKVKMKSGYMVGLLCAVAIVDLFGINKRYVDSENFVADQPDEVTFSKTAADAEILQDKGYYRVMDVADMGGSRSSYFHKTIGGYHAAKLTRYNDLLTYRLNPINESLRKHISEGTINDSVVASYGVLNMLNAKYIMAGDAYMVNEGALGNAWFVDKIDYVDNANEEMDALGHIDPATTAVTVKQFENVLGKGSPVAPGDTIYLKSYAPDKLVYGYKSAKGGVAVFSDIYFPWGWITTVDGKDMPLARVDYVLRGMKLPAGEHEIVMTFKPRSLEVTNAVSVASVVAVWVLCLLALAGLFVQCGKKETEGDGKQ